MKLRFTSLIVGLAAYGGVSLVPALVPAARAAEPAISEEARAAIENMGKTLSATEFSFTAQTIRVYQDADGQPLHIFHTMKVVAHRPDKLAAHVTGDDGSTALYYDGKTITFVAADKKKYASVPAPNTIEAALDEVSNRLGVDFPLADLLAPAPDKAFLTGVTTGKEINTVMIDGVPCRHLFFTQPPGIELELWVDKTPQALPRRLIVTYRLLPGQPEFVAEFSDWNVTAHLANSEFAFQPPAGMTKVELKAATAGGNK